MDRRRLWIAAVAIALFLVIGIGTGGALCKLALNCHLRSVSAISADRAVVEKRIKGAAVLPTGYTETVVARDLVAPTDFGFLPDGRLLVAEKSGILRIVDPATGVSNVALDISSRIDDTVFRGLLTVAVDPDFASNRFIYVVYTPSPLGPGKGEQPTVERFSRFVLGPGGKATNERVLVGRVSARSCTNLPATADCMPADRDHGGAQLAFAKDGTIFLATGDGGGYDERVEGTALRAQDPDSLGGKVLHITREGKGIATNPWAGSDLGANRAKVWAVGLRNPFRIVLHPAGFPVVADVGDERAEEVDVARPGANFGWPCWEGTYQHTLYAATSVCKRLYAAPPATLTPPVVQFLHPDSAAITGGDFGPAAFPAATRGAYFVADWERGWMRTIRIAADGTAGPARPFATGLAGPVAIHAGPRGGLYYAALNAGEIRRIDPSR